MRIGVRGSEMDQERLQNINREIGDEKILHARRDVEIEADTVVFYGGAGSHQKASVRWKREGVKPDGRGTRITMRTTGWGQTQEKEPV